MGAMEKMVLNMLGITQQEMQKYVTDGISLVKSLDDRMARIEKALGIEEKGTENDNEKTD